MSAPHRRREFLKKTLVGLTGAAVLPLRESQGAGPAEAAPLAVQVVDTHVHFYDPTRSQGVPWPPKDDAVLYRTVLPAHYRALKQPRPVEGVIVVEASPWLEDNQWVLDLAARSPLILGLVGSLPVGEEDFEARLRRFAAQPLFRGVRLRPSPARAGWGDARFLAHLRFLAEADLALDLVGGNETLELAQALAAAVPSLRIVIDHLAGVQIDGKAPAGGWLGAVRAAARRPNVFMKVSGLVEGTGRQGGHAPGDLDFYKPTLDAVWDAFGEDRLIYGSNWPVCEHFADLATVERLAADYFVARGGKVLEKVMSHNSQRAYQWRARAKKGNSGT